MKANKIIGIIFYCSSIIFFICAISDLFNSNAGKFTLYDGLLGLVCLFAGYYVSNKLIKKTDDNDNDDDNDDNIDNVDIVDNDDNNVEK